MRVLCLTPWFPPVADAQSGNFILDSVLALESLGNSVKVLVTEPWRPRLARLFSPDWGRDRLVVSAFPKSLGLQQVPHVSLPRNFFRGWSNSMFRRRVLPELENAARTWQADVIHAHTELPGCIAVEAAQHLHLPAVVTLHGINQAKRLNAKSQINLYRKWLTKANRIVLVGDPLVDHFAAIIGRSDHFRVVPNGFRLDFAEGSTRSGDWPQVVQLISVSNLHEGKGVDLTLQALAQLRDTGIKNWSYTIVGDGAERPKLEKMLHEMRLSQHVNFLGACSHRDVFHHLAKAQVFVLPSYREAFGVAYLEAMSMGLLAIGVEGQGPSAFIQHNQTGLLVAPRCVASLSGCLNRVLQNPREMIEIAQRGQAAIRRDFSCERHAQKLMAVYDEAVRSAL